MNTIITRIIAPLWYALTSGLMYTSVSYRALRNAICRHYGPTLYNTEEETTMGLTVRLVRKEGTPTVSPMRRMADKLLYDKLDIDSMLAYVRHVYVWLHLHKKHHKTIGLSDEYIYSVFKRLNMPVPKRPGGIPKIMWVWEEWYQTSALHKIIFTALSKGQHNIFIPFNYKIPYTNSENLSRAIQSYNDFRGTIWFNGKITYTVFDIVEVFGIVEIHKESDISNIKEAGVCYLMPKITKKKYPNSWKFTQFKKTYYMTSNNGKYIQQWRLEKFYENNPDGKLYAVLEQDGVCIKELLLPEDKRPTKEYGQYVGVYQEDQDLLESEREQILRTTMEIAQELYQASHKYKLGWTCIEDALPAVYQSHPWLRPIEEQEDTE